MMLNTLALAHLSAFHQFLGQQRWEPALRFGQETKKVSWPAKVPFLSQRDAKHCVVRESNK